MFTDPTTLIVWITAFCAVAAVSIALSVVTLTATFRQSRPSGAGTRVATDTALTRPVRITGPSRHAA
jgi:hypothetical protein